MAHNTQVSADTNAPPITRILADFVATHPSQGWSASVEAEAHRTFLNWVGCAIGGSRHATVEAALAAVQELAPAAQASILGRSERVDMASAALLNGITSHTFDFDDTHLRTIIHPGGPVASAALALAEHTGAGGRALIDATVLGIDVCCRVGNGVYPDHYDRGWHITGATGMLGAAAACARLLGLGASGPRWRWDRGLAAGGRARTIRHDDQATSSGRRRARGIDGGAAGPPWLHRVGAGARSSARPAADLFDQVHVERDRRSAGRALRDFVQHVQTVCLRHRDPPDRRLRAVAQSTAAGRANRKHRTQGPSPGARGHRKEAPSDGLQGKFSVYHGAPRE